MTQPIRMTHNTQPTRNRSCTMHVNKNSKVNERFQLPMNPIEDGTRDDLDDCSLITNSSCYSLFVDSGKPVEQKPKVVKKQPAQSHFTKARSISSKPTAESVRRDFKKPLPSKEVNSKPESVGYEGCRLQDLCPDDRSKLARLVYELAIAQQTITTGREESNLQWDPSDTSITTLPMSRGSGKQSGAPRLKGYELDATESYSSSVNDWTVGNESSSQNMNEYRAKLLAMEKELQQIKFQLQESSRDQTVSLISSNHSATTSQVTDSETFDVTELTDVSTQSTVQKDRQVLSVVSSQQARLKQLSEQVELITRLITQSASSESGKSCSSQATAARKKASEAPVDLADQCQNKVDNVGLLKHCHASSAPVPTWEVYKTDTIKDVKSTSLNPSVHPKVGMNEIIQPRILNTLNTVPNPPMNSTDIHTCPGQKITNVTARKPRGIPVHVIPRRRHHSINGRLLKSNRLAINDQLIRRDQNNSCSAHSNRSIGIQAESVSVLDFSAQMGREETDVMVQVGDGGDPLGRIDFASQTEEETPRSQTEEPIPSSNQLTQQPTSKQLTSCDMDEVLSVIAALEDQTDDNRGISHRWLPSFGENFSSYRKDYMSRRMCGQFSHTNVMPTATPAATLAQSRIVSGNGCIGSAEEELFGDLFFHQA